MKLCPYCAEEIQDAAIVCRWCGRDLNAPLPAPPVSPAASGALEQAITDHVAVLWELRKGARVARCELWRHPLGWEVRCDVDGEMRQTAVQRRRETAEDQAHDWQQAFRAKGWA